VTERSQQRVRVEVRVQRGAVNVLSAGKPAEVTRVEAGHSWSQVTSTAALAASDNAASADAAALAVNSASPNAASDLPAPLASLAPGPAASEPGAVPPKGATRRGSGADLRGRDALPSESAAPASDAKTLFEQASSSWREGRITQAAEAYQALLTAYPRDARAGLAAFELGRLRMDRLGDLPGAVRALERAVASGAGFREDALARLVKAYAGVGNVPACRRTREQYLREYANGVHRLAVTQACGAN
jgi:TolA-binding protein